MNIVATDDESLVLENLVTAIKEAVKDAKIDAFIDPFALLEFAKTNPIDIAFCDIKMRGINGIKLVQELKTIQPKVNIIFVTGYDEYMSDAFSLHASGYLLKPVTKNAILKELDNLRNPVKEKSKADVRIQTFGNFEVFYKNTPVVFLRKKSKEILAYLVDKQGTSVSSAELIDVLWEDGINDRSRQKMLQVYLSDLMKSLSNVGIDNIIIKNRKGLLVDKTKFECDLYQFFKGDIEAINSYTGQYMYEYPWAELTVGYLDNQKNI